METSEWNLLRFRFLRIPAHVLSTVLALTMMV